MSVNGTPFIHGDLTQLEPPAEVAFHRPGGLYRFPSPLFDTFDPCRVVGDVLHTCDLGVGQYVSGQLLAFLIRTEPVAAGTPSAAATKHKVLQISRRYRVWFQRNGDASSKIKKLNFKNLVGPGGCDNPRSQTKGMEGRLLFKFALHDFEGHLPRILADEQLAPYAQHLLNCGKAYRDWLNILASNGVVIPPAACRQALALACRTAALYRASNGKLRSKFHHLYHISKNMPVAGNPVTYSTYLDESLNNLLRKMTSHIHPDTFAVSLLKRYWILRLARGMPW